MPAEGLPWLERDEILRFEEIERLVALLASMGVRDVRLTGGEPLVRREFPRLVAMLAASAASTTSRSPRTATCSSATPTALVARRRAALQRLGRLARSATASSR